MIAPGLNSSKTWDVHASASHVYNNRLHEGEREREREIEREREREKECGTD